MTWLTVSASATGTSHLANDTLCEDSCWIAVDTTSTGAPLLSIFVSDGAGSAARGGRGAELAIEAAAEFAASLLHSPEIALTDESAVECTTRIRGRIYNEAEALGLTARDFACTFIGLISSPSGTVVFQIGDGGAVVDVGNGFEVCITPMSGEYANMTRFVTDEDAISALATRVYSTPVSKAAAFSDGVQRLALNLATNTVHEPFFTPFFEVLSKSKPEDEDQLQAALVRFLESPAVNERTDDDKTLALAVLT